MKRFSSLLLVTALSWTAAASEVDPSAAPVEAEAPSATDDPSAPTTDPVAEALRVIRGRVVFDDKSLNGRLSDAGFTSALLGLPTLLVTGSISLHGRFFGRQLTRLNHVALLATPVAMVGGGIGLVLYADRRRRRHPAPPRPEQPPTHYQTPEGLNDFMGLAPERQLALAHENPELGAFLIQLAEAYTFIVENEFTLARPARSRK